MKKIVSLTLVFAIIFALCMPAFGASASQNDASDSAVLSQVEQDDFTTIKARWKKSLVGDESNDKTNTHVAYYMNAVDSAGSTAYNNTYYITMDKTISTSGNMTTYFNYAEKMAICYTMPGSKFFENPLLTDAIENVLNWLLTKYYSSDRGINTSASDSKHWSNVFSDNYNGWYNWSVASPLALINTLILLEDELDADIKAKALAAIEALVPDIDKAPSMYAERGSNMIYFAKIRIGTSLLKNDTATLQKFLTLLEPEFEYVGRTIPGSTAKPDQGFHPDGSYIYHTRHFLNGTYGSEHFEMLPEIAALVKDTGYAFEDELAANLFEMYRNSFEPLIYADKMISMANGRAPYGSIANESAKKIMKASLSLITLFDGNPEYIDECTQTKIRIKEYYSTTANLNILPIELSQQAYAIVNDNSLSEAEDYHITKIYTDGDKAVHHTDSFMTAVSMSSSRVYNYESLTDGYTKGWYLSDGMQYTYMPDDSQYDDNWFYYSDPYKRPGTTVDTQEREAAKIAQGDEYLSSKDFVGGVSLGNTGVTAMDLESYHNNKEGTTAPLHTSTLTAKKSWFMFDNEVVSLGTDIDANDGYEVRTILDNRKMTRNYVYIDGVLATKENVPYSAKHLNFDDKIGYVFPDGEDVTINVNDNYSTYVEAWISHGVNPNNADYAYITLPGKTSAETATYAGAPDAQILSNTSSVQAVKDNSTNTTGYVFWKSGSSVEGITANNPCTVATKDEDGYITMAVSDPTHKLDTITLTLEDTVAIPKNKPDNVTFNITNGNTVIVINSSNYSGESYEFSYYEHPSEFGYDSACVKSVNLGAVDNNIDAKLLVLNPSNAPAVLTIALATYGDDGQKLISVISDPVTVSAKSAYSGSVSLPLTDCSTAKVFVWEKLKPINNADKDNTILNFES